MIVVVCRCVFAAAAVALSQGSLRKHPALNTQGSMNDITGTELPYLTVYCGVEAGLFNLVQQSRKRAATVVVQRVIMLPGPNFIELLKHTILLKYNNPCLVKSDYRPIPHLIVMLSKQYKYRSQAMYMA